MGGVAKRRFGDHTAPGNDSRLVPCRLRRTALFSGQSGRIDQVRKGVPLRHFGPEPASHFQRGHGEIQVDAGVFVTRKEEADGVVSLMQQYEIGERHDGIAKIHNNPYICMIGK